MSCGCNSSTSIFPANAGCPPLPPGNQHLPTPCLVAGSGLNMCADWIGNMQVTLDGGQVVVRNGNCLQVMYSQTSGPMRFDAATQKMIITSDALQAPLDCDVYGLPVMGVLAECGTAQRFLRFQTPVQDFTGVPVAYQQKCGSSEYRQINLVPKSMPACPPTGLRRTKSRMIMCQGTPTWEHYKEDEIHQDEAIVLDVNVSESVNNAIDPATMVLGIWQKITCTDTSGQQNTGYRLRKIPEDLLRTYIKSLSPNELVNMPGVLVGQIRTANDHAWNYAGLNIKIPFTAGTSGVLSGPFAVTAAGVPADAKTVLCLGQTLVDGLSGAIGRASVGVNSVWFSECWMNSVANFGYQNTSVFEAVVTDGNITVSVEVEEGNPPANCAALLQIVGYRQ